MRGGGRKTGKVGKVNTAAPDSMGKTVRADACGDMSPC